MREQWFALSMLTVILLFSATFMALCSRPGAGLSFIPYAASDRMRDI